MSKQMTFVAAMKDYFGYLPNTAAADFLKELKALTPEDKAEFRHLLSTVGYEIVNLPA